jgi:Mg/Co/Ni transporter MgtE
VSLPPAEQRAWMRLLPPDDAADLVQAASPEAREHLLTLLDSTTRHEVNALLAYAEDAAGGLMNPRYARLRPDMTVDEAISYLHRQAREQLPTIYSVYVLDEAQRLIGVVSFRELFAAPPDKRVRDVMRTQVVTVRDDQDQESVSRVFAQHDLAAIPVVDADDRIKGVITVDDIVDVVHEEATEDIHISSGGNSGSQASTLVIRAMALEEVRLRDWWRVIRREFAAGLALGAVLGAIGFLRIVLWQMVSPIYGEHYLLVAYTVFGSLIGVVTFGTLAGSLLPFTLRRLGFDPASASAPFVATLVDVTGLVIYFMMASVILRGTLL